MFNIVVTCCDCKMDLTSFCEALERLKLSYQMDKKLGKFQEIGNGEER